jgi:hypothetical protein
MTFSFSNLAAELQAGKPISADHVLSARRWAWSDGGINQGEADTIFELNRLAQDRSPEWVDFFVEAITEFVVNQPPRGYVDAANADWLIGQIDRDGKCETLAELELLVKVMDSGLNTPDSLKDYALRQIEAVVLTGQGPTRRGGDCRPGTIDETEVNLLRRLLFASAGQGAATISHDEAELLWRLKDATLNADNAPGWKTLFVQGVGNHLMAHNLYNPLQRERAAELEAFVNDHSSSVGGFLGRMIRAIPSAPIGEAFGRGGDEGPSLEQKIAADQELSPAEVQWLKGHVEADGTLDDYERALIDFVEEESGSRV